MEAAHSSEESGAPLSFDYPSGHTRILDAMRWKSQNQGTPGY